MRVTPWIYDGTGRANRMRVVWSDDGNVTLEIEAKHSGDTVVNSAATMPRVVFADAMRKLGVLA